MPYLRIYHPEEGRSIEEELRKTRIVIGRQKGVDILLDHPTVSRLHALMLKKGDGYVIDDYQSLAGTIVNNQRISSAELRHGDTIQIGLFVLEYRTDDGVRRASLVLASETAIMRRMRMKFRLLPRGVRLRYRAIYISPGDIFSPGDTLHVGEGGILVPSRQPLAEGSCVEVEIATPAGKPHTFLGEILLLLAKEEPPAMGIKLHNVESGRHAELLRDARRGSWQMPIASPND